MIGVADSGFPQVCMPHTPFTSGNDFIVNTWFCGHAYGRKHGVYWRSWTMLRVALRAFFPTRRLLLRDQVLPDYPAFLPFLEHLLIILFIFVTFFSKRLENIIHLLRLSFIPFSASSLKVGWKSSKALSDQSSFLFGFFFLFLW